MHFFYKYKCNAFKVLLTLKYAFLKAHLRFYRVSRIRPNPLILFTKRTKNIFYICIPRPRLFQIY